MSIKEINNQISKLKEQYKWLQGAYFIAKNKKQKFNFQQELDDAESGHTRLLHKEYLNDFKVGLLSKYQQICILKDLLKQTSKKLKSLKNKLKNINKTI